MVERAGCGNPMKILLMGDEFSAQDARRFNFVQEVTPVEQELSRAIEIADRISQQALLAVQAIRENARTALTYKWQAAQAKITVTQQRLYNTEDAKEGVQSSFVGKRAARFWGR